MNHYRGPREPQEGQKTCDRATEQGCGGECPGSPCCLSPPSSSNSLPEAAVGSLQERCQALVLSGLDVEIPSGAFRWETRCQRGQGQNRGGPQREPQPGASRTPVTQCWLAHLIHLVIAALHNLIGINPAHHPRQALPLLPLPHARVHVVYEAFYTADLRIGDGV